ncbi:MAG: hypothetical protein Q7U75_08540 [Desulfobacterales bacterium]|nr:hypothetical protein [Desulfobacterales bacterium]
MPPKKSKVKVNRKQASPQAQFAAIESRLAALDKEYAAVQAATGQLVAGLLGAKTSTAARESGRVSKATRTSKAKPGRKPGAQVVKKSAAAKAKPGRKPKVQVAGKRGRPAATKAPRQTVESVVIALLKANKKPMAFPEIMATIQKRKLIKTKSANFANVLRRTISTSEKIKRVSRGTYRA